MNAIKKLFEKRAADKKFKSAGPAHTLSESASSSKRIQRDDKGTSKKGQSSHHKDHRVPNQEAERAAAAALERVQQQKQPELNWSSQAIKNQAKKELELENSLKEKLVITPKQIPTYEADCPNLTVSGVYFSCPFIDPEVLPKKDIESKIRSFLYDQLEEEKGLTACLMIHTLNKNKSKVEKGVETLARYLTNIIDNPTEEKYRKIRLKNKAFQERVADLEGAFDFLTASGFTQETLKLEEEEEDFFILKDENLDIDMLQGLKEALLSAEPILPVLDRNLKVFKPADFVEKVNLPREFFRLTVDEVKREQGNKTETVEMLTQLRTKAMREKDEVKERHIYKFTLVRIRFPDGIILQGTFSVYEKLYAVREFVAEHLADSVMEFDLLFWPSGNKLTEDEKTLLELKLVPSVVLNFQVANESRSAESSFLNSECMTLLSDL